MRNCKIIEMIVCNLNKEQIVDKSGDFSDIAGLIK
jgi:hypothetical protein